MFDKKFIFDKKKNTVETGANIKLSGRIVGQGNRIVVKSAEKLSRLTINISGNDNHIEIGERSQFKNIAITVGSATRADGCELTIGEYFTCENGCRILLYNSGNICRIGDSCMFSKNIQIRCGELPHLIFDSITGEYLDVSEGVFIGDHIWVGEDAYIAKKVTIPDECVIGAKSVVTKRFDQKNVAIAGNPARVVRTNIQWIRNLTLIDTESVYYREYSRRAARRHGSGEDGIPAGGANGAAD